MVGSDVDDIVIANWLKEGVRDYIIHNVFKLMIGNSRSNSGLIFSDLRVSGL